MGGIAVPPFQYDIKPMSIEELFREDVERYVQEHHYTCSITPILKQFENIIDSEFKLLNEERRVLTEYEIELAAERCATMADSTDEKRQYNDVLLFLWNLWNKTAFAIY